jgi:ABC-type lipoprotein release transport system permease subunit
MHLLRIVGRFRAETAIRTADVVLVTDRDARRILGVPGGGATDFAVWLANENEADAVTARIAELSGTRLRVIERERQRRAYGLTFDTRGGLLAIALLPTLAALLLLAWERLTGLGADERREIAILKAVGWETRDVLMTRLWESSILALLGSVLGVVLAYAYVFPLGAPGLRDALFGWSLLYPTIDLVPATDPAELVAFVAIVVIPFVAIGIVPAWRASIVDLEDVVRGGA